MAASDAKVLITGESGVGKELVALAIHSEQRAQGSSAVRHGQLRGPAGDAARVGALRAREGQLHGRVSRQAGHAREGRRGSIFLDEIGEMSLRMQGMLLRFLETGRAAEGRGRPRRPAARRARDRGHQSRSCPTWWRRGCSARTCSTASTSSTSTCRRCATDATTSRCCSITSSRTWDGTTAIAPGSRPKLFRCAVRVPVARQRPRAGQRRRAHARLRVRAGDRAPTICRSRFARSAASASGRSASAGEPSPTSCYNG